jgi:hypothetical protein
MQLEDDSPRHGAFRDRDGEEWVRWGAYLHRPVETVPLLPRGATSTVPIGADGLAEWRWVALGASPFTASVSGARAWRAYGPAFESLAAGGATGQVTFARKDGAGEERGWLLLYGSAGESVRVAVE